MANVLTLTTPLMRQSVGFDRFNDLFESLLHDGNQGFDNYGENINFHEIMSLNTKNYFEKILQNKSYLRMRKKLNNPDIHHYSKIDKNIIVDFKSN